MRNLFADPVLRVAAWQAVVSGAVCGAVGTHVVLRRLPFFVVALGHATFPGVVLAAAAGASAYVGGVAAGLLAAGLVVALGRLGRVDDTSTTGIVLAGTFALGMVLRTAGVGGDRRLADLLVGSVLFSGWGDVAVTAGLGAAVLAVLAAAHKELVLHAFDPEGAAALGYRGWAVDLLLLGAVAVTAVTALPAVGALLVVSLLTVPAMTARLVVPSVGWSMVLAGAVGAGCGYTGLLVSARWALAAGASIAVVATGAFGGCLLVSAAAGRAVRGRAAA